MLYCENDLVKLPENTRRLVECVCNRFGIGSADGLMTYFTDGAIFQESYNGEKESIRRMARELGVDLSNF